MGACLQSKGKPPLSLALSGAYPVYWVGWYPDCLLSSSRPLAEGWWQPLLAALSWLLPEAEFLVCRTMPVLSSRLALGCRVVLLLLLWQKELGAEQRGLLLQRGTAGHHPSQHYPGECTQFGLCNPLQGSVCTGDHLKIPQEGPHPAITSIISAPWLWPVCPKPSQACRQGAGDAVLVLRSPHH